MHDRGAWFLTVIDVKFAPCCLPSVKKQKHDFLVCFVDRERHRKSSWRQGLTNSKRSTKVAMELFVDYVKEKKLWEPEEKNELAQTLKTFYVEARKKGFVQCIIKQLLDSVFVISRIIKVFVRIISLSLRLRLITPISTLIILDIAKTSSHNCLIFGINTASNVSKVLYVILRAFRRVKFEKIYNITYKSCHYLFILYAWWRKYHSWYFKIVSKFTRLAAREIMYNNVKISLVVFMPNITTNHAINYTNQTL